MLFGDFGVRRGDAILSPVIDDKEHDMVAGKNVEVRVDAEKPGWLHEGYASFLVQLAAQGVDVIYNIAALYREAGLPAAAYRAVNADGVVHVIESAHEAGARRVVHCSTVGVHGDIEHPPASEEAPLKPGDVYQETKLLGEQLGREAAARAGVELVIARPTGIYGPGDRRLFKLFGDIARGRFVML